MTTSLIGSACCCGLFDRLAPVCEWFKREEKDLILCGMAILGTIALLFIIDFVLFNMILIPLSKKTKTTKDDLIFKAIRFPIKMAVFIFGFRAALLLPEFPPLMTRLITKSFNALLWALVIWLLLRLVGVIDKRFQQATAGGTALPLDAVLVNLLRRVLRAVIWAFAIIMVAQNVFDLNVGALLAGAGVIGLAVAFAAQNTLANIFGAIVIIADKPFAVGDMIKIGDAQGTVEGVGLRSTTLRSLDGHVWTVPNRLISDSNVVNISRRPNTKYSFTVELTYSTTTVQLRRAMAILHEILDGKPYFDMEKLPPAIYFTDMAESSLNISVTVWFVNTDFKTMQTAKQEINLEILERFGAENLVMAYPTQSIYIENN